MMAQIGLGTLGLSGKYRPLTQAAVARTLAAIDAAKVDFIDSASVYKQSGVDVDALLTDMSGFTCTPVTYKVGADFADGSIERLMDEYHEARRLFGGRLSVLMLHRVDISLLEQHRRFFDRVASEMPELALGLSTNNSGTLRAYSDACDVTVLQCALNLLDLDRNLGLLTLAGERGMTIQARSCLSSGLLSGHYGENDARVFTDSIRSRFAASERGMAVYRSRIEGMQSVQAFHSRLVYEGRYVGSLASFCYAAIAHLPQVDRVIVGGVTAPQINENLTLGSLGEDVIDEIVVDYSKQWARDAL